MDEKRIVQKKPWRDVLVLWTVLTLLWFVIQAGNFLYISISHPYWLHDPQFVPVGVTFTLLPPLLLLIVLVTLKLLGFRGRQR